LSAALEGNNAGICGISRCNHSYRNRGNLLGWVEDAYQFPPAGMTDWDQIQAVLQVPTAPWTQTTQTVYFFPGVQSTLDGGCGILQPVLQWGTSPAGGGEYWTIASWWWSSIHPTHTPLSTVNWSDFLRPSMYKISNGWTSIMYDSTNGAQRQLNIMTTCRFNQAFPAVLEVDQSHPISSCSQMPNQGGVLFNSIWLWAGSAWSPVTYAPTTFIYNTGLSCVWNVTTGTNSGGSGWALLTL
jgi:hypothetical protein